MLAGISKEERHEFVSSLDVTEPKTIFIIGNIPARMKIKFAQDAASANQNAGSGGFKFTGDFIEVVLAGLKEIQNGHDVITEITDEVLGRIPMEVLVELVGEIFKVNVVGSEEKKN
jgi:hypothetical protein